MLKNVTDKIEPVHRDTPLRKFLNKLEEHGAIPVEHDGEIEGIVSIEEVMRKKSPTEAKAGSLITHTTRLDMGTDISEAAQTILNGRHRAVPVISSGQYEGVVTERSILRELSGKETGTDIGDLANDPITISSDETAGRARAVMRDERVGKLPVVDSEGTLVGVVSRENMLELGKQEEGFTRGEKHGDFLKDSDVDISVVMDDNPLVVDENEDVSSVARKMGDRDISYALITDGKRPTGIVTCGDLLELLTAEEREGVYVQITGGDDLGSFEEDKLHQHIDEGVQKIGRIYPDTKYLYVHLKEYEKDGTRSKWSLRTRVMTPVGIFRSESYGYDLAEAIDEAMDNLERIVKEDHEKRKEKRQSGEKYQE